MGSGAQRRRGIEPAHERLELRAPGLQSAQGAWRAIGESLLDGVGLRLRQPAGLHLIGQGVRDRPLKGSVDLGLALAALTVRFVPRDWPRLNSWGFYPAIICGQHSLEIFCLGVFLAFAGHFAMVEVSGAIWMQVLISVLGILLMIGTT